MRYHKRRIPSLKWHQKTTPDCLPEGPLDTVAVDLGNARATWGGVVVKGLWETCKVIWGSNAMQQCKGLLAKELGVPLAVATHSVLLLLVYWSVLSLIKLLKFWGVGFVSYSSKAWPITESFILTTALKVTMADTQFNLGIVGFSGMMGCGGSLLPLHMSFL